MKSNEKIKYYRNKRNLTQQQLADKVGYKTASAINKIELGLREIGQSKLKQFADALNVAPADLVDDDPQIVSKTTLKLALFGGTATDEQLDEVLNFAKYIKERGL